MSKRNILHSFLEDDTDEISHKNLGRLLHDTRPLNKRDVVNKSDVSGDKIARANLQRH